jgi:hypothetical protein
MFSRDFYDYEEYWGYLRNTKQAIRARATLLLYTVLFSLPFIALTAVGSYLCGLQPHEITGITCYNTMLTSVFIFDTLRNAAHACFDEALAEGLVSGREGIPEVAPAYPHHWLARLSFAIGPRPLPGCGL